MANDTKGPLAKATASQTQKNEGEGLYSVYDTLAREALRVHTPVIGKDYSLSASVATLMPRAHALIFLRDPAFRVIDDAGNELKPLPIVERSNITGGIYLRPGQIVATLEELTDGALAARCATYPGASEIVERGSREMMVRFILDTERKRATRLAQATRPSGAEFEDVDDMPDSQLDQLMPKLSRHEVAA